MRSDATSCGSAMDSTSGTSLVTYCPGRQAYAKPRRRRKATWLFVVLTDASPRPATTRWTS